MSTSDIVKWVKRRLGFPILNVEVPDETIEMCIEDAINEVQPWYNHRCLVTVPTSQKVDITDFNVYDVVRIYKSSAQDTDIQDLANSSTSELTSSFFGTAYVYSPYDYGIQRNYVYSKMESMLYQQSRSYTKDNISFMKNGNTLMVDIGTPSSDSITIEFIPKITLENLNNLDESYMRFIKDFTLAFTREVLGELRGKFRIQGPTELDYDHQYDKSSTELERLRQQIRDEFIDNCILD